MRPPRRLRVLNREGAISGLLARLRVKPRVNTDIVDVTYSAPDPYVAQHVLKPGGRHLQERERRRRATAVHTTPRVPRVPTQGQRFAPGRRAAGRSRRFASAPAPTGRGRRWRVSRPDWRGSNCSVSNSRQSDAPTKVSWPHSGTLGQPQSPANRGWRHPAWRQPVGDAAQHAAFPV